MSIFINFDTSRAPTSPVTINYYISITYNAGFWYSQVRSTLSALGGNPILGSAGPFVSRRDALLLSSAFIQQFGLLIPPGRPDP